jgi:signal transduction histidine kinase
MLKRLSLRFTAVGVAALFCVELLMVALINGLNVRYAVSEADEMTRIILDNQGKIPESFRPDKGKNGAPDRQDSGRRGSEIRYITRYFTVMFSADGSVDRIDTGNISSVTSEQAQQYAIEVVESAESDESDESVGFYSGYDFRYAIKSAPDGGRMVVFYDFGEKAQTILRMLEISGAIALILLAVFSLVILLYSKRAVRPVTESIENQRRFITDAGHELKTPLAIIRADAEVIEMTGGENEWTASILNQTDRLSELLSQMLMLTKLQETVKTNFTQLNFSQIVSSTAVEFEPLFSAEGKSLAVETLPDIRVSGDEKMLATLVSVLMRNASKYSSSGEEVAVKLIQSGGKAVLTVSNLCDEPPKNPDKLFERFYRADSSRTRETGGSGIGLSIAKTIADSHKAKIFCTVDGRRVTFTFKINKCADKGE